MQILCELKLFFVNAKNNFNFIQIKTSITTNNGGTLKEGLSLKVRALNQNGYAPLIVFLIKATLFVAFSFTKIYNIILKSPLNFVV